MPKNFFLTPTAINSGLTSVALGFVRCLDRLGVKVGFFKPIALSELDTSIHFVKNINGIDSPQPILLETAQKWVSQGKIDLLMEKVVEQYSEIAHQYDVIVVEGLVPDRNEPYTAKINVSIARNLDSDVVLVASWPQVDIKAFDEHIDLSARLFAAPEDPDIVGCVINRASKALAIGESRVMGPQFKLIGQVPFNSSFNAPRIGDIGKQLSWSLVNREYANTNARVSHIAICSRTVPNLISEFVPGALIVTSADRDDVVIAASMSALSGTPLAGLVLTGDFLFNEQTRRLCRSAFEAGLAVYTSSFGTFETASALAGFDREIPADDRERMERVMDAVADQVDQVWLKEQCAKVKQNRMSPPAFRYQLSDRARSANKRIVLPEGDEPRTVVAATICHERGLARCVLIGEENKIKQVAHSQGVELPANIAIVAPSAVRAQYVESMVKLREHKGLTPEMALAQLEDNVVLGTMMVVQGEVDGLVSGAVNTTANTVRPALQLIKTKVDAEIVSSVFFMCLPEQVLVYGDCAINPDPSAKELADIAIQSAHSAAAFGIEPRVAMISYSTGESGSGSDVDKVKEATQLARLAAPDLLIDGPLQYDAAAIESVAAKKAPDSAVAGRATVFVFPDLNTGNTTYKAVQRSANVISVGPMLQGLNKPVNDLSRGALIEDIVFTIALTAVQAHQSG